MHLKNAEGSIKELKVHLAFGSPVLFTSCTICSRACLQNCSLINNISDTNLQGNGSDSARMSKLAFC